MIELARRPWVTATLSLSLLFGGLLLDLTTRQDLVVAITFNIPIAVTGLSNSRLLTVWTVLLALGANVAAGYENALTFSGYDAVTLLNRGLAAMSFLLVGVMTLAREGAVDEVEELQDARDWAERERRLRRFVLGLTGSMSADELISRATLGLRTLLDADAVVVATLREGRLANPRWTAGSCRNLAVPGEKASWAVDAIPINDAPAITVRSERGRLTMGRWRRDSGDDLVVVADVPRADRPSTLLGEALQGLEPLLRRADSAAREHPIAAVDDPSAADR